MAFPPLVVLALMLRGLNVTLCSQPHEDVPHHPRKEAKAPLSTHLHCGGDELAQLFSRPLPPQPAGQCPANGTASEVGLEGGRF